jgi:hypothetical protein
MICSGSALFPVRRPGRMPCISLTVPHRPGFPCGFAAAARRGTIGPSSPRRLGIHSATEALERR